MSEIEPKLEINFSYNKYIADDYVCGVSYHLTGSGSEYFTNQYLSMSEGEPEDMIFSRDLNDFLFLDSFAKAAYRLGQLNPDKDLLIVTNDYDFEETK